MPNTRCSFWRRAFGLAILSTLALCAVEAAAPPSAPNIVIIFCDDIRYGDVGVFGARGYATPHIDRLASEGIRFTRFYVAQAVCSASRAGLLTGCYPNRIGIAGALGPGSPIGIHPREVTLGELVKPRGYATAIFGKWHLGDHRQFLPIHHGFDEYMGLPYSNDMWPNHPEAKPGTYPPLPLIEGDQVKEIMPDQTQLTTRYTERAVRFIERSKDRPFLLYLAHSMPHVPLFVSEKREGKTTAGLYGDVIAEIDWSVGRILGALNRHGLDQRTLVIFTSDNGPWLSYGNHAGSAGPLREGKGTCWEGGVRVPFIARWPGHVPAGALCGEPAMTIDLFPTIARLTGADLPAHRIDGLDIWPLLSSQPNAQSPHEAFFFYFADGQLQAVSSGPWKLLLPHTYRTLAGQPPGRDGQPAKYVQHKIERPELYDLDTDIGETRDVASEHPEVVRRLEALAERARGDLGDALAQRLGAGVREPGRGGPASGR